MIDLTGKGAVVTGAASGIGAATAALLARLGAQVLLADIDEQGAEARAAEIKTAGGQAIALATDVRDEAQVQRAIDTAVAEFGGIDILHNNAADIPLLGEDRPLADIDSAVWDATMLVDLAGPMYGCKHAIPHMERRGGGSIVNTGSISGVRAELYISAYNVAKAGLVQLARTVAMQYGRAGIRCNTICPGFTLSPPGQNLPEEMKEIYRRGNPLPYFGQPEDIASLVAFLGSDQARIITGQCIMADAGLSQTTGISPDARDFLAAAAA